MAKLRSWVGTGLKAIGLVTVADKVTKVDDTMFYAILGGGALLLLLLVGGRR